MILFIDDNFMEIPAHPISSEREILHLPIDNWFEVGLKLQLKENELKQIQRDHYPDTSRMKIDMLTKWFQSYPEASYETLIRALAATDNRPVAEELCSKQGLVNILLPLHACSTSGFLYVCIV